MTNNLLKQLNPAQAAAVKQTDGPVLILAGAGSGKTRVLTYKVAYLIAEKGISPDNLLMVTFTNKAAGEMKQRIIKLSGTRNLPLCGTFHAICAKILRRWGRNIGIPPEFLIYDDQDQKEVIKEAVGKLDLDRTKFKPAVVAAIISQAKNELISSTEYPQYAYGPFQKEVGKIYLEYQKILRENQALDFDDLIFMVVRLLEKDKDTAGFLQDKFRYILVDEYQDTNRAQYVLTKLLAKKWRNLCVVGDASQSIYAWRGADFRNIVNFQKDFSDTKVFHLEQNYRSTKMILDTAYSIISKNQSHPILKLWTDKNSGNAIKLYQARNEHDEAEFITREISNYRYYHPKSSYSDFVVLYRTNAQSRVIEEELLSKSIPYLLVGGVRFYERKEIKDVLAYLRLLVNPADSVSLKRTEKIGKKKYERFLVFAQDFKKTAKAQKMTALEILDQTLESSTYLDLYDPEIEEEFSRLENIRELRSVAAEFNDLSLFLENVALVEQEYLPSGKAGTPDHPIPQEKNDALTLMTLHAAKGLEFKTVFIVGMEEGLFPHSRSLLDTLELEEERRLCYVGVTRAMENLYLTFARHRLYFGQRNANQISRFILDIPEHLVTLAGNDPV